MSRITYPNDPPAAHTGAIPRLPVAQFVFILVSYFCFNFILLFFVIKIIVFIHEEKSTDWPRTFTRARLGLKLILDAADRNAPDGTILFFYPTGISSKNEKKIYSY